MTFDKIIESLTIAKKYTSGNNHCFAAEHDEIWISLNPSTFSVEDRTRMEELGWYDQGMTWSRYV